MGIRQVRGVPRAMVKEDVAEVVEEREAEAEELNEVDRTRTVPGPSETS